MLDLRTGRVLAVVDTEPPLLGWHDEWHVVRVAPGTPTVLEVLDLRTGRSA